MEGRRDDKQNGQPANRLHLNLGFTNTPQNFSAEAARQYPTTPSTFPQPVFQNQYGQRETWGAQSPSQPQGYGNMNYFVQNHYPNGPSAPGQAQSNLTPGGLPYRGQQGYNGDTTNGLAQQFSHQNLGGNSQRPASPYRAPVNGQRQRNGPQQSSNITPVNPLYGGSAMTEESLPDRDPSKYPDVLYKRAKATESVVKTFFKDNVARARERNQRAKELDDFLNDPNVPAAKKEKQRNAMWKAEAKYLRFLRTKESPDNFNTIKVIGKGAFGEVRLVQRKNDNKIYALKSLIKSEMHKREQLAHVRAERDILAESNTPWVVNLFNTFQDSSYLYMLMEFLPGGDLMTMLIKYEIFSEDITRFYMAQLVTALDAVHKQGFVHRDIKPDNILLDRHGHIKLTDFGLSTGFKQAHDAQYYQQLMSNAKPTRTPRPNRQSVTLDTIQLTVSNRTAINTWRQSRRKLAYSTVGTPDYIAPEIFSGKGYNESVDWWSVGTIMYECMVGWPPFCAEETNETYRKIVDWKRYLHFPSDAQLSHDSESFMRGLINDESERLGKFGATEIKQHAFFRGVDWASLRKIRAPFEPKLTSAIDTQYFPIDEIPQQDSSAAVREKDRMERAQRGETEESAEMSLPFIGYTFKRFDANTR